MSVSLISLRLEIASDYPLLPHIHFSARQKRIMSSTEGSKAKVLNSRETSSEDEIVPKYSIEKSRGSRQLQEMTVETLENIGLECSNEEKIPSSSNDNLETDSLDTSLNDHVKVEKSEAKELGNLTQTKIKLKKKSSSCDHYQNEEKEKNVTLNSDNQTADKKDNLPVSACDDETLKDLSSSQECVNIDSNKRNRLLWPSTISFSSGNHLVEVTKGLLHLYKENQRTTLAEEAERSEMLCILAVPAAMTTHELLQFVAPVYEDIEHMRIIKENKPNMYMVLVKFRNQYSADTFYKKFNGMPFNSIEPEICHLAFVAKVETIKESEEACLPLPGHTELPTCPVCLERMDESVEGILTILCNHSFHGSCLAKWGDTSCPVCRYSQTPEMMPDNRCVTCGSQDSLWICLICGHIGCGRYVDGHAYHHYLDTQHTYAMQIGNNRVWDYAGDNYVHRLIQNKADGKPVELEPLWVAVENEEKMDSMQLEYTYLLTSQLEAQRHYFEDRLTRIEAEALKQLEEMKEKTKHAVDERKQLEEKLNRVTKDKQSMDKKISQLSTKLNRISLELKDEKEEIKELNEQVRDLMFYFEAKDKLQDIPDVSKQEIQEGQIVIGEASGVSYETPKQRKKKHK